MCGGRFEATQIKTQHSAMRQHRYNYTHIYINKYQMLENMRVVHMYLTMQTCIHLLLLNISFRSNLNTLF